MRKRPAHKRKALPEGRARDISAEKCPILARRRKRLRQDALTQKEHTSEDREQIKTQGGKR
jgi:hypothetical protein